MLQETDGIRDSSSSTYRLKSSYTNIKIQDHVTKVEKTNIYFDDHLVGVLKGDTARRKLNNREKTNAKCEAADADSTAH